MSETLEGTIERVTFTNEETGFAVIKVAIPGRTTPTTITGSFPTPTPGETFSAQGNWHEDPNRGKQFKATSISTKAPTATAGIEQFLASGTIDGIGPSYAKKIVAKFGEETLAIIDHNSKKLEDIPGIGSKKRKEIKASWDAQKTTRKTMIFLHGHGIPPARAAKIYAEYGEGAEKLLKENPFALADDIAGIGFKTADSIAAKIGVADDDPRRLGAAALHALEHAASQGHCALTEPQITAKIADLTSTDAKSFATANTLAALVLQEALRREEIGSKQLYFLPRLFWAEHHVAAQLATLAKRGHGYPKIQPQAALTRAEKTTGTTLAPSQRACVLAALERRILIITGGPGVGKTTIVNTILTILKEAKVAPVLAAPTGRAARRLSESSGIDATTIHKLLEYQPGRGFTRNRDTPIDKGDLFVIDEASMVDITLMAAFLQALPKNAHLLLVGDVDQLPSVGAGAILRDIIDSGVIPVSRLTEIFRQAAASHIVQAAHAINSGDLPELNTPPQADFFFIEREAPDEAAKTILHLVSQRIPKKFDLDPIRDIQVLTPMHRGPLGTSTLNDRLQQTLNPQSHTTPATRNFRPGDRIIQLRNNDDLGLSNGDIGTITHLTQDPPLLHALFDNDRTASYGTAALDELSLAYAITIHKSQGSEFPCVVIPLTTAHHVMLQRNLLYTAVTRGKRLVILVGSHRALTTAITTATSGHRTTTLAQRLKLATS